MPATIELLRRERRATVFFAAFAQSALGTGAGYVALLLVAYERFHSPWAITLVLAADLVPAMLLGPVFGAAADRFSRRTCVVLADLVRAVAFVGIALVDGFGATVALAALAGTGTGLFNPAALAALPALVTRERLPAATSLYSAIADVGYTAGPGLAALLLLVGDPDGVLLANGITFAVSALVLRLLPFGRPVASPPGTARGRLGPALVRDAVAGIRAVRGMPAVMTVLFASSAALFFAGAFNVGELLFATEEVGAGEAEFSLLVAVLGLGVIAGSLSGSRGGSLWTLRRRFLAGLAFLGVGFLACGLASSVVAAALAFGVVGFGNGLVIVYERLLVQSLVTDELTGRVFGMKDALSAWAFALAFVAGAALIELIGVRGAILLSAAGTAAAWLGAAFALRGPWTGAAAPAAPALGLGGRDDAGQRWDGADRSFSPSAGLAMMRGMPYDEDLANRIRELVAGEADVTEQRMFGGLAFLVAGNMSVAASGQGGLMVRVDPAETDALLAKPHAQPFEMRGRTMQGWLRVDPEGLTTNQQLERWVRRGVAYARSLPPKP